MTYQKQMRLLIILVGLFCLAFCLTGQVEAKDEGHGRQPIFVELLNPMYKFTYSLFSSLNNGSSKGLSENMVVSPISLHMALNMVLLGTDGLKTKTGQELYKVLGFIGEHKDVAEIVNDDYEQVLHAIRRHKNDALMQFYYFNQRYKEMGSLPKMKAVSALVDPLCMVITKNGAELLPKYKENIGYYYNSTAESVNDRRPESKTKIINYLDSWSREAGFTSSIIKRGDLDGQFTAILLSAIRVQAYWKRYNFEQMEAKTIFYNHGMIGSPVKGTQLSHARIVGRYLNLSRARSYSGANASSLREVSSLEAQVVSLAMDDGLTYNIFEPLEHSTPGDNKLKKLTNKLFAEGYLVKILQLMASRAGGHWGGMKLTMPKFKFEKVYNIKEVLESMGLKRIFNQRDSEIPNMTGGKKVHFSKATHQAMIEINDQGVKAAGVIKTAYEFEIPKDIPDPIRVSITKPFVFLVTYGPLPLLVGQLSSL